jgi:hypothetical protein
LSVQPEYQSRVIDKYGDEGSKPQPLPDGKGFFQSSDVSQKPTVKVQRIRIIGVERHRPE